MYYNFSNCALKIIRPSKKATTQKSPAGVDTKPKPLRTSLDSQKILGLIGYENIGYMIVNVLLIH